MNQHKQLEKAQLRRNTMTPRAEKKTTFSKPTIDNSTLRKIRNVTAMNCEVNILRKTMRGLECV